MLNRSVTVGYIGSCLAHRKVNNEKKKPFRILPLNGSPRHFATMNLSFERRLGTIAQIDKL
jgi:hypothetical protein